jgi:hypothetical protein
LDALRAPRAQEPLSLLVTPKHGAVQQVRDLSWKDCTLVYWVEEVAWMASTALSNGRVGRAQAEAEAVSWSMDAVGGHKTDIQRHTLP